MVRRLTGTGSTSRTPSSAGDLGALSRESAWSQRFAFRLVDRCRGSTLAVEQVADRSGNSGGCSRHRRSGLFRCCCGSGLVGDTVTVDVDGSKGLGGAVEGLIAETLRNRRASFKVYRVM